MCIIFTSWLRLTEMHFILIITPTVNERIIVIINIITIILLESFLMSSFVQAFTFVVAKMRPGLANL